MSSLYQHIISFIPEHENWGIKGLWMVHMDQEKVAAFVNGFCDRNLHACFETTIRPYFPECGGTGCCLTFELRAGTIRAVKREVPRFLSYLSYMGRAIVYKEDGYGYNIDDKGRILKTWELDDGMC